MLRSWTRHFLQKTRSTMASPEEAGRAATATGTGTAPIETESAKINEADYQIIKEGKATILAPKEDKVFYNPIQQFNRDLSVMGIKAWSSIYQRSKNGNRELKATKKQKLNSGDASDVSFIRILEALSATGLRAIRYGHEIGQVQQIVANDLLPEAVKSINRNIVYNQLEDKVKGNLGNAITYMSGTQDKFHVIDLDPYGTATPFLDSAIQAIKDDGLLLVTCTDAGVLAGSGYPEKCFALYGGNNFGNTFMGSEANHEVGIRLILGMIAREAAKYKKSIEPLLSLSIDFYFRVFVRVRTSPIEVKKLASSMMLTHHCCGCGENLNQPLGKTDGKKFQLPRLVPIPHHSKCQFCESYYGVAGPMWGGQIHNDEFVDELLTINSQLPSEVYHTRERVKGMVTLAKNELQAPFYFNLNQLSSFMKAPPLPINDFARAVGELGYDVSLTHAKKNCVKTDAPWDVVLKINQAWLLQQNGKLVEEYRQKIEELKADPEQATKLAKFTEKLSALEQNMTSNPNLTEGMIGYKILRNTKWSIEELQAVKFDADNEVSDRISKLRKLKMVRYQENPTKNWGPKARPSA